MRLKNKRSHLGWNSPGVFGLRAMRAAVKELEDVVYRVQDEQKKQNSGG
jgi:hypothetical protein